MKRKNPQATRLLREILKENVTKQGQSGGIKSQLIKEDPQELFEVLDSYTKGEAKPHQVKAVMGRRHAVYAKYSGTAIMQFMLNYLFHQRKIKCSFNPKGNASLK